MSEVQEEELVGIAIDNYITKTEKVSKDERTKMNKITDHYAKSNQHSTVVNQIFSSFKKNINKLNLITTCKRFLLLLDQVLEQSCLRSTYKPYAELVSQKILECFVHVFSLIFHYKLLQASLDWKVYRMLWAKSIKDQVFDALRQQIAQKHRNFDLNRGLTQESIERIKKRYARKNFSEDEVKRYMEGNKTQIKRSPKVQISRDTSNITNTRDASESSSSNEEIEPQKRDPRTSLPQGPKREVVHSYQNFGLPENNGFIGHKPNSYPIDNAYVMPHPVPNMPIQAPYMNYSQTPQLYPLQSSFPPSNGYIHPQSPYRSQYPSPQPQGNLQVNKKQKTNDQNSYINAFFIMRKKILFNMFECKQCGINFQSKQNFISHQQEHLIEAQHQLQRKQFSRASQNQINTAKNEKKHHLCSIEDWNTGLSKNQDETQQQITIHNLPQKYQGNNTFTCYFCQEELRIGWCSTLQDWALEDSIKIKDKNEVQVAHSSCFYEFVQKQEANKDLSGKT